MMRIRNPTKPGNRLGMPLEAWPIQDQMAWNAAFTTTDLLLIEDQVGHDLRDATKITMGTCYARWLVWLNTNEPDALGVALDDRATPERVKAYLRSLCPGLATRTIFNYAARLKRVLELLAANRDWSWFTPLLSILERRARAASSSQPKPVIPSYELFRFGIAVMEQAEEADGLNAVDQAESYRDGLMIAFLAMRPLRIKNMLGLQFGTTFVEVSGGYEVALTVQETKTWIDLEFPLPQKLTPFIQRYLTHYRNILAAGRYGVVAGYADQADYLWLARNGRQFPVASFEDMISHRTTERFGIRLTPHSFRHCAATTIAERDPEDLHILRIILGHSTIATAEQYYIKAKDRHAIQSVQSNLVELRKPSSKRRAQIDLPSQAIGSMLLANNSKEYKRGFTT